MRSEYQDFSESRITRAYLLLFHQLIQEIGCLFQYKKEVECLELSKETTVECVSRKVFFLKVLAERDELDYQVTTLD